jgi:DNA-binding NarL/FixJ family response regulator
VDGEVDGLSAPSGLESAGRRKRVPGSPEPIAAAARPETDGAVALVGLSPVYAHGLRLGFTSAGLTCSTVAGVGELPPLLGAAALVAVLPHADGASLASVTTAGAGRVEAVHVLPEGSVQAYTDALRAGATGAFAADAELEHVVRVVRSAAVGHTLLPLRVARALSRRRAGSPPQLQRQERHYLRRLADGGTVASLARSAGYSEREMYRLLSAVYARLGATNRTEALLLAERWGLLDEEAS